MASPSVRTNLVGGVVALLALGFIAWLMFRPGSSGIPEPAAPPASAAADSTPAPIPSPAPASGPSRPPSPPKSRNPVRFVDPGLPEYAPQEKVAGRVQSVGSDTMNNMITLWAEGVRKHHPAMEIYVEGKGSSTATPALVAGTAHFGPMSREMKQKEIDDFKKKHGHEPTGLATSIDMLAVYVHKDNPIQGLTLPQVDAIFSKDRKGGYPVDIRTWGDLGLTGEWADRPISLYGRNSASGTYGYFKVEALRNGPYKVTVMEQPGSSAVVQCVAKDLHGIGYSGIGYRTSDVRAVPLAAKPGEAFVEATKESALSRAYPLSRFLWLYVDRRPGTPLDPVRREFLLYVFSSQGQLDVVKDGYFPLTAEMARAELAKVGL